MILAEPSPSSPLIATRLVTKSPRLALIRRNLCPPRCTNPVPLSRLAMIGVRGGAHARIALAASEDGSACELAGFGSVSVKPPARAGTDIPSDFRVAWTRGPLSESSANCGFAGFAFKERVSKKEIPR